MLHRRLLLVVAMVFGHFVASGVAFLVSVAAAMSGCDFFVTAVFTVFFFPYLVMDLLRIEPAPLDSFQGFILNSVLWVVVVYSVGLLTRWFFDKLVGPRSARGTIPLGVTPRHHPGAV